MISSIAPTHCCTAPLPKRQSSRDAALISLYLIVVLVSISLLGYSTAPGTPPIPTTPPIVASRSYYGWPDYIPLSVLATFATEYGVEIVTSGYTDADDAVKALRGAARYDVVLLDNELIPQAAQAGLLAYAESGLPLSEEESALREAIWSRFEESDAS